MLRGLFKLTWLEIKIFVREPLGFIGTVGIPVAGVRRPRAGRSAADPARPSGTAGEFVSVGLPVLGVDPDRAERGDVARHDRLDLPRGRHPQAAARDAAAAPHHSDGPRARQAALHRDHARADVRWPAGATTRSALDVPLVGVHRRAAVRDAVHPVARVPHRQPVPTARFAQPIASIILYPMLALSGLFVPIDQLPPALRVVAAGAAAHVRRVAAQGDSGKATRGRRTSATSRR